MKWILSTGMAALITIFTGCNSANDGSPKTDTTQMAPDTNMGKDTVNHINRADGTLRTDTPKGADTLRTKMR